MRRLSCLPLLFCLVTLPAAADQGQWIETSFADPLGAGPVMQALGDRCLAVTMQSTDRVLFYSSALQQWFVHPFGTTRSVRFVGAAGELALVVTDSTATVFDAATGTIVSRGLVGTLLSVNPGIPSAACSATLALVVTNSQVLVCDPAIGGWQAHDYTGPPPYLAVGKLGATDDFAFFCSDGTPTRLIAYSLPQHGFAELTGIGSTIPRVLVGGLAHIVTDDGGARYAYGYCAATGAFSTTPPVGEYAPLDGTIEDDGAATGPRLSYVCTSTTPLDRTTIRMTIWHFAVGTGTWSTGTVDYDPHSDGYAIGGLGGARHTTVLHEVVDDHTLGWLVYDGLSGGSQLFTPQISTVNAHHVGILGGNVLVGADSVVAVGRDLVTGSEALIALDRTGTVSTMRGRDYACFTRTDAADDSQTVYVFDGPRARWLRATLPAYNTGGGSAGRDVLVRTARSAGGSRTMFYSALTGAVRQWISGEDIAGTGSRERLAVAFTPTWSGLFDAETGELMTRTLRIDPAAGLGRRIAAGTTADHRELHGYSLQSHAWTVLDTDQDAHVLATGDLVALAVDDWSWNWYAAYDGLNDCWVPLEPEGTSLGSGVGGRLALVLRHGHAYVYEPGGNGTPVALAGFRVEAATGIVNLRWSVTGVANPADFRLTVRHGTDERSLTVTAGTDGFHAVDTHPSLVAGGTFLYRLAARDGTAWRELASRRVELAPARPSHLLATAPNPFNPVCTIAFRLAAPGRTAVTVHDPAGREVARLLDAALPAGDHRVTWHGRTTEGRPAASGIYVIRLIAPDGRDTRKVQLVR